MSLFNSIPAPENNVYLIVCPLSHQTQNQYPTNTPLGIHSLLANNLFPIQVTETIGPHRVNRKLSYFEHFKRSLQGTPLLLVTLQEDPTDFILALTYELAYIGFPMFNQSGEPVRPIASTKLSLVPAHFPSLQSIPLPSPEILQTAHVQATNAIKLAQQNRKYVNAHRNKQLTNTSPNSSTLNHSQTESISEFSQLIRQTLESTQPTNLNQHDTSIPDLGNSLTTTENQE